jgi:hypothetical protein
MASLGNALQELHRDRSATQLRLEKLNQIISGIESLNGTGVSHKSNQATRVVSAASRRKMALAQKARWAGIRKQSQSAGRTHSSAPAKRTISAAGRKRIAAAQRARWAKVRAGKNASKPPPFVVPHRSTAGGGSARRGRGQVRAALSTRQLLSGKRPESGPASIPNETLGNVPKLILFQFPNKRDFCLTRGTSHLYSPHSGSRGSLNGS